MNIDGKINYIEFGTKDMAVTKAFFAAVFDWQFVDYGPEYCSVTNAGIDLGFFQSTLAMSTVNGSALVIFYSVNLAAKISEIEAHGGAVVKPIFAFPGGWRFHFADPNGNEFAVWSDKSPK